MKRHWTTLLAVVLAAVVAVEPGVSQVHNASNFTTSIRIPPRIDPSLDQALSSAAVTFRKLNTRQPILGSLYLAAHQISEEGAFVMLTLFRFPELRTRRKTLPAGIVLSIVTAAGLAWSLYEYPGGYQPIRMASWIGVYGSVGVFLSLTGSWFAEKKKWGIFNPMPAEHGWRVALMGSVPILVGVISSLMSTSPMSHVYAVFTGLLLGGTVANRYEMSWMGVYDFINTPWKPAVRQMVFNLGDVLIIHGIAGLPLALLYGVEYEIFVKSNYGMLVALPPIFIFLRLAMMKYFLLLIRARPLPPETWHPLFSYAA